MGIPSPLWTWINDIIVIKRELGITVSEFDITVNNLAVEIYKEGYDARFQTAQVIPVFINELIIRFFYSIRRIIRFFSFTDHQFRSFSSIWKACEPFSNATIKRMLTVAHGSFCLVDIGDATIRGIVTAAGYFNVKDFFMRINVVGIGRFTISLYGEAKISISRINTKDNLYILNREKKVVESYIKGLQYLSELYDDRFFSSFTEDLQSSDLYVQAFENSIRLAEKRNVPDEKILKSKADIDCYFLRSTNNV